MHLLHYEIGEDSLRWLSVVWINWCLMQKFREFLCLFAVKQPKPEAKPFPPCRHSKSMIAPHCLSGVLVSLKWRGLEVMVPVSKKGEEKEEVDNKEQQVGNIQSHLLVALLSSEKFSPAVCHLWVNLQQGTQQQLQKSREIVSQPLSLSINQSVS